MSPIKKRYGNKKVGTEFFLKWAGILGAMRRLMPVILAASLFAAVVFGIRAVITNMPYFDVKEIRVIRPRGSSYDPDLIKTNEMLKKCRGESIFRVDINRIASAVRKNHPELRRLEVNRVMPNVIAVEIEVREPVVMVRYNRFYPVDSEGVLLSPDTKITRSLPLITGISYLKTPKIGERIESKQLRAVLLAYNILKSAGVIKKYGIKGIEVSNLKSLVIYLGSGLEVRIGEGKLADELKKLDRVMKDPAVDKSNLKYIDLRFDDVALGIR